ncbi:hypothetical protein VTO42DRAFT_2685 [Malbranchea cinnamomea]
MICRANIGQLKALRLGCGHGIQATPIAPSAAYRVPSRPQHYHVFQSAPLTSRTITTQDKPASATAAATTIATREAPRQRSPLKRYALITACTLGIGAGFVYFTDTRASAHRWLVPPLIRWLYPDAEDAHHFGVDMLRILYRFGLHPRERGNPDGDGKLVTQVFGHTLCNPIGISGGLDKDAEIPNPLFELGPAIVEVGGCTPLPQPGNPRTRVFRLPSQKALINRYGLNSKGADHMAAVLRRRVREFAYVEGFGVGEDAVQRVLDGEAGVPPGSLIEGKLLAVQVAKNKTTPDGDIEAIKRDYVYCVDRLAKYADILVVNVSSPNTPGLRDLQKVEPLTAILKGVVEAAQKTDRKTKPKVMVKVSPDEDSDEQVAGICHAVWESGVDGVIVGNTTNRRPEPIPKGFILPAREQAVLKETGGFSGPHLFRKTVALVKRYREILDQEGRSSSSPSSSLSPHDLPAVTEGADKPQTAGVPDAESLPSTDTVQVPPEATKTEEPPSQRKVIFASGGITNGQQALEALNAGASVAMLYTGMVYGGSGTITRIKEEMREQLEKQ